MENKRMSELPIATVVNDEDYTIIVQDGINKRASRDVFKQKNYDDLNNRPYINSMYSSSLNPVNELFQGTLQFHKISKTGKYSDLLELPFIATKLTDLTNDGYFVQDQYYMHTDNNLTNGLLEKINSAVQAIKVNNTLLSPNANQEININMPTKLTDLTNDAHFVQDENYIHTDNNFTNALKNNYDNLVVNVNQPVSANNKLATMNDIPTMDSGYWSPIEEYINIIFDGVYNSAEEAPTEGTYAILDGEVVNKYTDGISDNLNIPVREGHFIFAEGTSTETIYYIKDSEWKMLGESNGQQASYDVVTTSKNGLMSSEMLTKLNGIAENADNVTFTPSLSSGTKIGTLTINGTSTNMYAPASSSSNIQLGIGNLSGSNESYTSNENTAIFLKEGSSIKNLMKIEGSGGTTVGSNPLGTLYINSEKGSDQIYAEFMTYWSSYADKTNLTTEAFFSINEYDRMIPGAILVYEDANNSSLTYYGLILFEKSGYPYKSGGGRYFTKEIYVLNTNGAITKYSFCCDAFGDESVYKGTTLP